MAEAVILRLAVRLIRDRTDAQADFAVDAVREVVVAAEVQGAGTVGVGRVDRVRPVVAVSALASGRRAVTSAGGGEKRCTTMPVLARGAPGAPVTWERVL